MARLQSVSEQFRIARLGTREETQKLLVRIAKREHGRVMVAPPRPGAFIRVVDGRLDAPEEAVKPDGVIVYEYQRIEIVVAFALETLRANSPVGSGRDPHPGLYRDSHTLFFRGVPSALAALVNWKSGDEVAISNPVPYSRKIEAGRMKMTVPGSDHVYERAARIVNSQYGNVARVRFTYRTLASSGSQGRFPALAFWLR